MSYSSLVSNECGDGNECFEINARTYSAVIVLKLAILANAERYSHRK